MEGGGEQGGGGDEGKARGGGGGRLVHAEAGWFMQRVVLGALQLAVG